MRPNALSLLCIFLVQQALAHEHHDELTEEQANAPVDSILWIHMALQAAVWGLIFPVGMVLGITRSRWHVPLQSTGFALTAAGYILGHSHGGRQFLASAHGTFASILFLPIALQFGVGVYLKLHIHEKTIRPYFVPVHGFLGKVYPILGWVQALFGVVAFRGYCRGGDLGQCLAHYIMGSGFIAYGIIMTIMLTVGESWVRRSGRSPEWWDSWVILIWGIVNTFTEHRGGHWSVKDMQHTTLGIVWWAGGVLGVILSRNNQRTVVPSLIVILTGWAMSDHEQALMLSTKVHAMFGITLMSAGVARIIEVCFIASTISEPAMSADMDRSSDHTVTNGPEFIPTKPQVYPFRYLPPFLLVAGGLLFMSATDEELDFIHDLEMDHVTYVLIMFSWAFLIYALVLGLLYLYSNSGRNHPSRRVKEPRATQWYERVPVQKDAEEVDEHELQFVVSDE